MLPLAFIDVSAQSKEMFAAKLLEMCLDVITEETQTSLLLSSCPHVGKDFHIYLPLHVWISTHNGKTYLFCLMNSICLCFLHVFLLLMSSHPLRIPIFHCKTLFFTVNYRRPTFPLSLLLQIRKQLHIPLTA